MPQQPIHLKSKGCHCHDLLCVVVNLMMARSGMLIYNEALDEGTTNFLFLVLYYGGLLCLLRPMRRRF